jgi:hypothetical protein
MKKLVYLIVCIVSILITSVNAQEKSLYKTTSAPFSGTKEFCSFPKPVKFVVSITGNKVVINKIYKDQINRVTGILKN